MWLLAVYIFGITWQTISFSSQEVLPLYHTVILCHFINNSTMWYILICRCSHNICYLSMSFSVSPPQQCQGNCHKALMICIGRPTSSLCPGSWFNIKIHLTSMGIPIVEIRRSYDRLISTKGFPILIRWHLYFESGSWWCHITVRSLLPSSWLDCTRITWMKYEISIAPQLLTNHGRDKMVTILQATFSNSFSRIFFFIFLRFVPKCPVNNKHALFMIMAWCRIG